MGARWFGGFAARSRLESAELERAGVQASVRLVVDPVNPSLPCGDATTGRLELRIGGELRRRANRDVQAVAQPVLLHKGVLQPLDRAVVVSINSKRAGKPHLSVAVTNPAVATHGHDKLAV